MGKSFKVICNECGAEVPDWTCHVCASKPVESPDSAGATTNTTKGEIFSRRICDYCQGCPNAMDGNCCEFDRFNGKKLSPVC